MTASPELRGYSIVVLGSFNPQIFQPAWLAAKGLVSEAAADAAEIGIIHPDILNVKIDWLELTVQTNKFTAGTTTAASPNQLRDFTLGAFSLLHHTPATGMGLNCDTHYRYTSHSEVDALGDLLAPHARWQELLIDPKTYSVHMQGSRPDQQFGYVRIRVEPSKSFPQAVYVGVNDHYAVAGEAEFVDASLVRQILTEEWESSVARMQATADDVASLAGSKVKL